MSAVALNQIPVSDRPEDLQGSQPVIQIDRFLFGRDISEQGFVPPDQPPQIVHELEQTCPLMRQEAINEAVVLRFHDPHQTHKEIVVRPDGCTVAVSFIRLGPPIQATPERRKGDRPIPFGPEARHFCLTPQSYQKVLR